ncbi:hypothetical protein HK102_002608, partial [Quaeritorhiza haematococci]
MPIFALWLVLAASTAAAMVGGGALEIRGQLLEIPPELFPPTASEICMIPHVNNGNTTVYDIVDGHSIEGFDTAFLFDITTCECARVCNENPTCTFFVHDESNGACFIKAAWLQPDIQQFTWAISQQHPIPGDIFVSPIREPRFVISPSLHPARVVLSTSALPACNGVGKPLLVTGSTSTNGDNAGSNVPHEKINSESASLEPKSAPLAAVTATTTLTASVRPALSTTTVNVLVAFLVARGVRTLKSENTKLTLKKTITHNDQIRNSAEAAVVVSGQSDTIIDILSVDARFSECRDVSHQPRFRGRDPPRTIRNVGDHAFTATCDSQACVNVFAQITPGKIVNLPPTCGSHFTKIVTIRPSQTQPNTFAITYNFEFSTGVATTEPVTFEAHYGNVPNMLQLIGVADGNGNGTAVAKRDLERRRLFSSFSEWLEKISSISVDASKTFELSKSFEQVLFDAKGQCIRNGHTLTSELEVSISGSAFARGTFGVFVAGHLAPTPKIDQAYVYFKADSGARLELDMYANVHYQKREVNRLLTLPLTPFQIPGIGSVGPLLEIDVGYDAEFSMHGAFKAAVNVNIPSIQVAYGEQNTDPNLSPAQAGTNEHAAGSALDKIVQPSLQVDFQAGGSVHVFVIPKATLDIDLLEGVLDAQVGLSAQAGLRGSLRADASAGTGQTATASACIGLDATANVDLFAQGTAFWTQTATTAVSLYSLPGVQLFEKCFSKAPEEDSPAGGTPTNSSNPTNSNGGGSVLQPVGGNNGSTAAFRRLRRDIRGGLRKRLTSRVTMGLHKRSEPLFQITADLCPAEGSSGQDLDAQSCQLTPEKRALDDDIFDVSFGRNQTELLHLERRQDLFEPRPFNFPPNSPFRHQEFLQDVLRLAPEREVAGLWPVYERVPNPVFFRGINVGRTLHHVVPIDSMASIFRQIVFKNIGGPTRETEIWTMQCPSFIENLNKLILHNKLTLISRDVAQSFLAFTEALQRDEPDIDAFIAPKLGIPLPGDLANEDERNRWENAKREMRKFSADVDRFLSWLPFNIIVGPSSTLRSDDPSKVKYGRGGFDVPARCFFLCDRRLGSHMDMWAFLDLLDSFLSGRQAANVKDTESLCRSLTILTQLSRFDKINQPMTYNENMWDKDRQASNPQKTM